MYYYYLYRIQSAMLCHSLVKESNSELHHALFIFQPIPFSSIIQEKNSMVHKYVIGSMLAKKAISVFVQSKTSLAVVAMGPYVFHAQYWLKPMTENNSNM